MYLRDLLKPEKSRGCKIPSQVPVPSCSFQLHNCVTIKTNNSGNCAFIMNPFFLADDSNLKQEIDGVDFYLHKYLTSLWVNSNASLSGNAEDYNWEPTNINQVLPQVYTQYRLVSAAVHVKYIGRLDSVSGVVGGAIILDDINTVGGKVLATGSSYDESAAGANTISPHLYKYGNFELARDSYYHKENNALEGIRMLYFPIDNSYAEYTDITGITNLRGEMSGQSVILNNGQKEAFNWMFYAQSAPPDSYCFKVDIFCNFECLPQPAFLNYMPISSYPFSVSLEQQKKFILTVQSNPIMKLDEESECDSEVPDLFIKMIKKFKNGLPSLEKMRAWGIISAVPGLSSGLALAGNMIAENSWNNY